MKKFWIGIGALLICAPILIAQAPVQTNIGVTSTIVANNTTPVTIKSTRGTVYNIEGFNKSTTPAYIKLYNILPTCGTTIPVARYQIPAANGLSGNILTINNVNGDAYFDGIYLCVTTGIADNDTTAPAASTYIVNIHFK